MQAHGTGSRPATPPSPPHLPPQGLQPVNPTRVASLRPGPTLNGGSVAMPFPPGSNPAGQLVSSNSDRKFISPSLLPDSPIDPAFGYPRVVPGQVGLPRRGKLPLSSRSCAALCPAQGQPAALSHSVSMWSVRSPSPPAAPDKRTGLVEDAAYAVATALTSASSSWTPFDRVTAPGPQPSLGLSDSPPPPALLSDGKTSMATTQAAPTHALRARGAQEASEGLRETERLRRLLEEFGTLRSRHPIYLLTVDAPAEKLLAALGGAALDDSLGTWDRQAESHRRVARQLVERMARQAADMGGSLMPTACFFGFCKLWQESLLAIQNLWDGPGVMEKTSFSPLVQALGGTSAPTGLLLDLLDKARAMPGPAAEMVEAAAHRLLLARIGEGPGRELDAAVLGWLQDELAARSSALTLPGNSQADRGLALIRGSLRAFFREQDLAVNRLCDVLRHLMTRSSGQASRAIDPLLAVAIDHCGRALGARTSASPLARMQSITRALLETWASEREPAPYPTLARLIERLSDGRAISWLAREGIPWSRAQTRSLVDLCMRDLSRPDDRLAIAQALEWLEQALVPVSPASPASPEGHEPSSAPAEAAALPPVHTSFSAPLSAFLSTVRSPRAAEAGPAPSAGPFDVTTDAPETRKPKRMSPAEG